MKDDVIGLVRGAQGLTLTLDHDRELHADMAVLAIGNMPPEPSPVGNVEFYDTAFYRPDPWAPNALGELDPAAAVLLLGTGLMTMDAVISLLDQGHRGPICALSRRGLLPRRHAVTPLVDGGTSDGGSPAVPAEAPQREPYADPLPTGVNALTRFLRTAVARATAQGQSWQRVIDKMRPFMVDVW